MPDLIKSGKYQQDEEEKNRKVSSQTQPVQTIQKPSGQIIQIQEPARQTVTVKQTAQTPTATQQIMAQPVQQKWYRGDQPTASEMVARIVTVGQQNKQAGEQLWKAFQGVQNDPASPLYNPYKKSSSKAVQELGKIFNVDLSNGVGGDFIKENAWLMNYYRTGTGGTPLAPSKKSSSLENAAYWYYKIVNDEAGTQQAEKEWQALREEISYWTRRADRNYTDDEILNKIDWKKYPTLASLDEAKKDGVPTSLNRGIGYSQDNLRGVIWAARNGSTGDAFLDAVQYARGEGNQYTESELHDMSQASSDEYAPYMFASTMDDLAIKYSTYGFDRDWLETNKSVLDSGDEDAIKEYQRIAAAEETTRKAEDEWYNLRNDILYWANSGRNYSDEQILQMIDWSKYKTLDKLDDDARIGSPTALTRGIGYSQSALQNFIKNARGEDVGQSWQEQQEIRERLNPKSGSYLPYILGATGDQMDEAALYFGVYGFDKNWVNENAWMKASMDKTQRDMYFRVASAEEFTSACEQETDKLIEKLNTLTVTDPDRIMEKLNGWINDDEDFSNLKKLQKSLKPSEKLLNTTRALGFDMKDLERQVRENCAKYKAAQDDNTNINETLSMLSDAPGGGFSESDIARIQGENKALSDAADTIEARGTEAEKNRVRIAGNAATDEITAQVLAGIRTGNMDPKVGYDTVLKDAEQFTVDKYWEASQIIDDYENVQQLIAETQKQIDALQNSPLDDQVDEAKIQELEQQMAELNQRLQRDEELGKYLNEGVNTTLNINGKDYNISAELNEEGKWDVSEPVSQNQEDAEKITNEISNALINVRLNADPESSHAVWGNEFLTSTVDPLIQRYAAIYDVPEEDVNRISADFHKQWFANYYSSNDVLKNMVNELAANLREAGTDDSGMLSDVVSSWTSELPQFESAERLSPEELDTINSQQNDIASQIEGIRSAPDAAIKERQEQLDQLNGQLSGLQDELNWQQENYASAQGVIKDIEKRYQDAFDIADINNIDLDVSLQQMMMEAMWRSYQENSHDTLQGAQKWYDTATGAEKEQARRNLWFLERREKYDEIRESDAFKETQKVIVTPQGIIGGNSKQSYEDVKNYLYKKATDPYNPNTDALASGPQGKSYYKTLYDQITNDEIDMYLFLRGREGQQSADEYLDYLAYDFGERAKKAFSDKILGDEDTSWQGAVRRSIRSVFDNLASGAGATDVLGQNIQNWLADNGLANENWKPVDYNTMYSMPGQISRLDREKVMSLVDWQVKVLGQDRDLFDFLYGTSMSGIDSAAAGMTGSAWAGAALLGLSAADNTMQDMQERGASDSQVLLGGILAGVAETLFEHVSLSALYDEEKVLAAGGMKNIIKNIVNQAGINASEEFFTEVANIFSEIAVMGENNEYNQRYKEYVKKYGEKEAISRLAQDIALQEFEAAAGGGLMGGFFGITKGASAYKQAETIKNEQAADTTKRLYTLKTALSEEDVAKKIASISAAMTFGDNAADADMAKAASLKLADEFGADNIASVMSDILLYAQKNGIDPSIASDVAVYAGLGNSITTSALNTAIDRGINQETMRMLQAAVVTDEASQDVRKAVQKATRDDRIARYTLYKKVASGALESVKAAEADAQKSRENVDAARQDLEDQKNLLQEKANQVGAAFDEVLANPGNENTARAAEAAVGEYEAQNVAVKQREAALTKAEQAYEASQKHLEDAQSAYDQLRNEAIQEVDTEDQQRAQEAIAAEQAAQAQAEQEAAAQTAQQENDNSAVMDADAFIAQLEEQFGPLTDEERQKVYERVKKQYTERQNAEETAEMQNEPAQQPNTQKPNRAERRRRNNFVNRLSQKYNIDIAFEDTTRGNKVSRQNGYYDFRNNRIVLDENATIGDAIYFVAGHELTHVAERSGTYDDLASSLLRLKYGEGMDYRRLIEDINRRNDHSRAAQDIMGKMYLYNNRLAQMHEQDASIDATPLTVEEASQEVVADIMGEILHGNQDMVDRLVAEDPSTARRILESIKSFLRQLTGMDGQWKNDIQGVVDKLETALNDAQSDNDLPVAEPVVERYVDEYKEKHPRGQYSLPEDTEYLERVNKGEANEAGLEYDLNESTGEETHYGDRTKFSLPSDDILDQMISSYLASGGMLSTNVTPPNMPGPVRTNPNQKQRQFGSQTAQRSGALHEQVKQHLRENSGYDPDTNSAQVDRAISWVQRHAGEGDDTGYQGALDEILSPDFNFATADGQARMLTVMSMAALQNRASDETRIADAYNAQGTVLGQALQARQLFQLMTPLGREKTIRGIEDKINRQYRDQGKFGTEVHLSDETIQMARDAKTEEDFGRVRKKAYKELAEQMPSSWKDKLRAIRYFAMLANPVTHIRNMIGNAGFMPAVGLKNAIGAGVERAKGVEERTKTVKRASKEARDFSRNDAVAMKDVLTGESKYFESDPVRKEQKPFKGFFQKAIDFNSNLLEAEDWVFLRRHYANALSGWMTANNMTAAQLQKDSAALEKARAYAIEEAQKATYRDASKFASTMSRISRDGGVAGFLVDAALPFKKTPTNILKRGIEYSPLGLMKTIVLDSSKLKMYNDWVKNGQQGKMPSKALSPSQYIDRIASGLSGTAISAVGALMAAMGWLKVDLGDDDEIAKQNGEQAYALHVSLFGNDVSYTIDWLAPSSMPLFVGASIYNEIMADHNSEDALDVAADLTDSFLKITEPVFNLSMLDGVNSLLQTSSWGDDAGNNITDIGATLASNYVTSFTPTVLGKVARTIDTARRETFVESGTSKTKGMLERTWQKTLAKVPFATYMLKPYVSPLGEEEQSSTVAAAIQNFLSPGYFKEVDISAMEQEMQRLYEATGDKTAIPKQPTKYFTAAGEKVNLDAEQYTQLQKTRGAIAKDLLNQVVESPEYQIYGDDAKVKMVKDAWEYATQLAKSEIDPRVTVDSWIIKGQDNPLDALITRRENAARDEYIADHKAELLKALDEEDYQSADANIEGLHQAGKDDSYIKSEITKKYKPVYLDAYKKDDYDTMDGIEAILETLDLGYKSKDFSNWIKEYEKKKEDEDND